MLEDEAVEAPLADRYAGWQGDKARKLLAGGYALDDIEAWVLESDLNPQPRSGKRELLENTVNRYL